jgi:tetratricopeptide (TPR) repeat protein
MTFSEVAIRLGARAAGHGAIVLQALSLLAIPFLFPVNSFAADVDPWVFARAGNEHFYNVEYDEAIADFEKALAGDPENALFYNYLANAYLFREMYRLGLLDGNLYDASNSFLESKKPEPNSTEIARINGLLKRVRGICEDRLKKNPRDVDALYALGVTYAIEGSMKFTLDKSWTEALRAGSRANSYHERVLALDPSYHDAKLVTGMYQYIVGSIPRSVKWLAFLLGYRGSRTRGVELMQEAMVKGKNTTSAAAFLLSVVYAREKMHEYSRRLLRPLSEFYPRNPLVPLEIGRSYIREGNLKKALEIYVQVARDMEAGKPGYHRLPRERLWYQIGFLYQRQGQFAEALEAYERVAEQGSDGLLKAYTGLRRGEIYIAQNRLDNARAEYRRVAAMPYEEARRQAELRLRSLRE